MHFARFGLLAIPPLLLTAIAFAQNTSPPAGPGVDQLCRECGEIYEIREIATERAFARTLEEQASPAGVTINFSLGKKSDGKPRLGVFGTRNMSTQLEERSYEIVIRYDDGRFTRREILVGVTDLYVGARVRVFRDRIEPYDLY